MTLFGTVPEGALSKPSPYNVSVPDEKVEELKQLLNLSRIGPVTYENLHVDPLTGKFGLTRDWLVSAKEEWKKFDWRSVEKQINSFPNYKLKADETDVHFLALFSERSDAVPMILIHGWPACPASPELTYSGSILEFLPLLTLMKKEYNPKTLPYPLVVPSLPGYCFSSTPPLDHTGYISKGGDIGSRISRLLGAKFDSCKAVHLNFSLMPQPANIDMESLTEWERTGVERGNTFLAIGSAYAKEHASRPATIGLILSTNPLALLAWIGEKFIEWTDNPLPLHEILASVSLYWLTDTFPRAIYPYREVSYRFISENSHIPCKADTRVFGPNPTHHGTPSLYVHKPLGFSYFPKEVVPAPVSWVATTGNLCWSKIHNKGGHFAALEQSELMKEDLEDFVAQVWQSRMRESKETK